MVSPLWKACSEGQLDVVVQLLVDATTVDIELKDHTGSTPLIEAVRNGHVDIVKALLDKGVNPTNGSSQGRPDQYTSDPTILELLHNAQNKSMPNGVSSNQPAFNTDESEKHYYGSPGAGPDGFPYYPNINPSIPPVNENGNYYHPAHLEGLPTNGGVGNLPPPEIARMIPCRYFPACRYGAQCMFAHPQAPYFQGPMPPVQYPPFDPNPYAPQYYPSPQPYQQPPNVHPMSPMSPPPGPPMMHARTPSEVISPAPFSPNGAPHPPPPPVPYPGPVYPHPGQMSMPMGMPPIPPIHHSPTSHTHPGPQSVPNYPTSPVPPFPHPQDGSVPYPPMQPMPVGYPDSNGVPKSEGEHFAPHPNHREGGHIRRNAPRRSSFGGRKPPCLFFPAGRCKNGDDCRFPHVLNESMGTPHPPSFPVMRGPPRPRGQVNGHVPPLEVKMNNMTIRDDQPRQKNGDTSRSHSSDGGQRKFPHAGKHHPNANGHHNKKNMHSRPTQRVPNAEDFPVLAGTTTPPKLLNGVSNGLTAAQVLQAPAPRRESKEPSTRGASPDLARSTSSKDARPEVNGASEEVTVNNTEQVIPAAAPEPAPAPAPVAAAPASTKPPVMSFAAAAANSANSSTQASTAASTDVSKEVSVSA